MKLNHSLEDLQPECNGTICPAEMVVVNCECGLKEVSNMKIVGRKMSKEEMEEGQEYVVEVSHDDGYIYINVADDNQTSLVFPLRELERALSIAVEENPSVEE